MRKFILLLFLSFCFQISSAQYTEVINSKRPGFSDSPYSVGTGVYQVEAGFFYKNIGNYLYYDQATEETINYNSKSYGTDLTFRTSQFFERLEINLDLSFGQEDRNYTRPDVFSESALGLSKFTVGAKYLVYSPTYTDKSKEIRSWKKRHSYDWKRLIPAVGVYAGLNTNLLSKLHKYPGGLSPRFALFTQNDLSNKFVLLTNFIMDKTFTDEAENSYIITATYSLTEQVSIFAENQGFFRKNVPNDFQYGIGGAYLLNKNMQVDAAFRYIKDERGDDSYFFGAGVAWRLDRHKDKFSTLDSEGKVTKEGRQGGFFSRLFSKKDKKQRKVKKVKAGKKKVKKLKPKKTKAQKRLEKEAKKKAKEDKKQQKKDAKNYDKNYDPDSN
ncbi:transporter [Aureibaculum sp. 2210JD6-5]|uniref:transporter n=1 Tax=Aureibaculum sp. 2210JD6-5 TaxID=3103957 RepID=UPI002AAC4E69|nr:transporter [Aureibaculum sp. 2210JD6-5]MDY7396599.1 transporter [Aureibaculum sp. 2210JD6-5]